MPATTPVRIALVGLNFGAQIAAQLAAGPARRHLELTAVSDLDPARATVVARRHGVYARTWDELLADPSIEAIGLFTGPVGRADLIRQAIRANKHVLTTKPFEGSPAAAERVLVEADRRGLVVHLNSPTPAPSAELLQIARWRTRYDLGRVVGLRAEAWASYQEVADGSWYDDPQLCPVAPIFRLGIYLINDVITLAGPPVALQVAQTRVRTGRPTPDNASLTLVFRDGALASLYASFCVHDGQPYKNSLVVAFERGVLYRNCGAPVALDAHCRSELALVRPGRIHHPRVKRRTFDSLSGDYQFAAFAAAVRSGTPLPAASRDTLLAGLRVIAALPSAARTGRLTPLT